MTIGESPVLYVLFGFLVHHKIHHPDQVLIRRRPANPWCCISTPLLSTSFPLFETGTDLRRVPSESLVLSVPCESD